MPLPVRRPTSLIRRVLGRERWLRLGCGGRSSSPLEILRISPAGVTLRIEDAAQPCLIEGEPVDLLLPGGGGDHSRLAQFLAGRIGTLVRREPYELGVRFSDPLPMLLRDLLAFLD